jgi:hypothetical protein
MRCTTCPRDLADDVPVYRYRRPRQGGEIVIQCSDCAEVMAAKERAWTGWPWHWAAPAPCEGCGHPVIDRGDGWQTRRHVTCGAAACQRAIRAAASRARRPVPRDCLGCGVEFKPARGNARYCSPACKQRAYRQRLAITAHAARP